MMSLSKIIAIPMIVGLCLTAAAPTGAPDDDEGIEVILTDYEIQMPDSIFAGNTVFQIINKGEMAHSFAIRGVDAEELVTELDTKLEPGASAVMEVALETGSYDVFCPIGDHDDRGMSRRVTVAANAPAE